MFNPLWKDKTRRLCYGYFLKYFIGSLAKRKGPMNSGPFVRLFVTKAFSQICLISLFSDIFVESQFEGLRQEWAQNRVFKFSRKIESSISAGTGLKQSVLLLPIFPRKPHIREKSSFWDVRKMVLANQFTRFHEFSYLRNC